MLGELFVVLLLAAQAFPLLTFMLVNLFVTAIMLVCFRGGRTAPRILLAIGGRLLMGAGLWVAATLVDPANRAQNVTAILFVTAAMCVIRLYQEWEFSKQRRVTASSVRAAVRR